MNNKEDKNNDFNKNDDIEKNNEQLIISTKDLCLDNDLEIVNYNLIKEWRPIKRPAINRLGLELMGYFFNDSISKNIIGWGTAESKWMESIKDKELLKEKISNIFQYKPPLVICSQGVSEENRKIILELANKFDVPLCLSNYHLSYISNILGSYIMEALAIEKIVHGCLIIINGVGVLIIGDSGIGKSEAVLALVQKGHTFVSDDAVLIKRIGKHFIGRSPEITKDILEARGLGLIDIRKIYGERSIQDKSEINLVIELVHSDNLKDNEIDRLGIKKHYFFILNGKIEKIKIPIRSGRSISSLIEAATNLFVSNQRGINTLEKIQLRMTNQNKKEN